MYVSNLSICKRFTSTKYRVLITAYPAYYQMFPRRAIHGNNVITLTTCPAVAKHPNSCYLDEKKATPPWAIWANEQEPFVRENNIKLHVTPVTPNNKPPPSFVEKVGWLYLIQADKFLPFSLYKGNWRTSCVQLWEKHRAKKLSYK